MKALAVLSILLAGAAVTVAQSDSVEWKNAGEIGANDRHAILRLARRLGIDEPRIVEVTAWLPTSCPFVRVESASTVDGFHFMWREVRLRRQDWPKCELVPRFSSRREGRWTGSRAQLSVEESWRVTDEGWFVDLRLGEGVPYADAESIVRAIRRGLLVNRLPTFIGPLRLDMSMPAIDASQINRINKQREPGRYEVSTGKAAGQTLEVVIVGDTVELHNISAWMVRSDEPPNNRFQPTAARVMISRRG